MIDFVCFSTDLYHMCNDPRLPETNDRLMQINDSIQKDYQSTVGLAEHRHLLTVNERRCLEIDRILKKNIFHSSGPMALVR